MISYRPILHDCRARIPFSILGVFILLSSSFTSVYLSHRDIDHTEYVVSTIHQSSINQLIHAAESDISSMINFLGLTSLESIGKTPIMTSMISGISAEELNKQRFQKSLIAMLNQYLLLTFTENRYHNHQYAINILHPSNQDMPIATQDDVIIIPIEMTVNRPVHIPLIGPDQQQDHETYWKVILPLEFEIQSYPDNQLITYHTSQISSVILSRYPLLYHLTNEFNETLQGLGPFWGYLTAVTNIYSVIRGYRHYQTGKPRNVVDNAHLVPMINTGLLFEQGLVFGSIDPLALVDLIGECKQTFFGQNQTNQIETINELSADSFTLSSSMFTTSPSDDSEDEQEPSADFQINISEIVTKMLFNYDTIELVFQDIETQELFSIMLTNPTSEKVQTTIKNNIDDGTILASINKDDVSMNHTTTKKVSDIINHTYTATYETCITKQYNPIIKIGNHSGYPINNGSSPWQIKDIKILHSKEKSEKGSISLNDVVYATSYNVTWTRSHYWSKKETISSGNSTITLWSHFTSKDKKIDQNLTLSVLICGISPIHQKNIPINDVLYENLSIQDINLEDTLDIYLDDFFKPHRDHLLRTSDDCCLNETIFGSSPPWVLSQSIQALYDIRDIIETIQINRSINATTYHNPVTLLEKSRQDINTQYQQLIPYMHQPLSYMKKDSYLSTGNKAIHVVRIWFIDYVYDHINTVFDEMIAHLQTAVSDQLHTLDYHQQEQVLNLMDEQDQGSFLTESFTLPFGIPMQLENNDHTYQYPWNESLHLAIHQFPPYLSPYHRDEYEGKKEYFLAIRNICTLGPTGLPILPITPTTPWMVTLNMWLISVRGSYAEFVVADANDETIPHPLFGHNTQILVRKHQDIFDEKGQLIGKNTRIQFAFDTISFSLVPSWGRMIGDTEKGLIEADGYE